MKKLTLILILIILICSVQNSYSRDNNGDVTNAVTQYENYLYAVNESKQGIKKAIFFTVSPFYMSYFTGTENILGDVLGASFTMGIGKSKNNSLPKAINQFIRVGIGNGSIKKADATWWGNSGDSLDYLGGEYIIDFEIINSTITYTNKHIRPSILLGIGQQVLTNKQKGGKDIVQYNLQFGGGIKIYLNKHFVLYYQGIANYGKFVSYHYGVQQGSFSGFTLSHTAGLKYYFYMDPVDLLLGKFF